MRGTFPLIALARQELVLLNSVLLIRDYNLWPPLKVSSCVFCSNVFCLAYNKLAINN